MIEEYIWIWNVDHGVGVVVHDMDLDNVLEKIQYAAWKFAQLYRELPTGCRALGKGFVIAPGTSKWVIGKCSSNR